MAKPSFEQRLQRAERRNLPPRPGSVEWDLQMLRAARLRLREASRKTPVDEPPKRTVEAARPPAAPAPAPTPEPPGAEPKGARRPRRTRRERAPKPEPQWWEERVRWRHRTADDYDWDRPKLNECIHEYDPLTYDDEE